MMATVAAEPQEVYTKTMLEHLTSLDEAAFVDLDDASAGLVMEAQVGTISFMDKFASPVELTPRAGDAARQAFAAVANPDMTDAEKKKSLLVMKAPASVKHLAGMLTEYDWAFVEQADTLRSYVVAKLLEETKHVDARIRLKALQMVGNLTEVGSFTERIEVTKRDASAEELEARIRARLQSFLPKPPAADITDAEIIPTKE
jgi:hypothetical protein